MNRKKSIVVHDRMQQNYQYVCSAPMGKEFDPLFKPELTPQQMLALGVFGGRYMRDGIHEFPAVWFSHARLHPAGVPGHSPQLNYFKVDASQPLSVWRAKGWINEFHDPRGWFQWYCRYYMGRRLPEEDARQIKRWRMMRRHSAQIQRSCKKGDISCHSRQRQALLHWAYDSRNY